MVIHIDPNAIEANEYLDDLWNCIDPNYNAAYSSQATELGYYEEILENISDTNDWDDFEAFTEIRKKVADYIVAIDPNS